MLFSSFDKFRFNGTLFYGWYGKCLVDDSEADRCELFTSACADKRWDFLGQKGREIEYEGNIRITVQKMCFIDFVNVLFSRILRV